MIRRAIDEIPDWTAIEYAYGRARELLNLGRRRRDREVLDLAERVVDPLSYVMQSRGYQPYRFRRRRQEVFASDRGPLVVTTEAPESDVVDVDRKDE